MKTVRFTASILFYLSRVSAVLFLTTGFYAIAVVLLSHYTSAQWLPITIEQGHFAIFYPFTKKTFLLGDYTASFLFTNLFTIAFYGFFLWLLSDVFRAFRQQKLFTQKGVMRLSRFYVTNLVVPVWFLLLVLLFQNDMTDLIRIMFLHLVIGVFAFFMAAIFKQGLILQEEQDLTF
jgi:Protein of unknown function (DUF2975)